MTTTVEQAIQKIEGALKALEQDISGFLKDTVAPAIKTEFTVLEPQILGLGQTLLGMVWQGAAAYLLSVATGGTLTAGMVIDSIVAQLPAELKALEHLVAGAFAGAVQSQTKPTS